MPCLHSAPPHRCAVPAQCPAPPSCACLHSAPPHRCAVPARGCLWLPGTPHPHPTGSPRSPPSAWPSCAHLWPRPCGPRPCDPAHPHRQACQAAGNQHTPPLPPPGRPQVFEWEPNATARAGHVGPNITGKSAGGLSPDRVCCAGLPVGVCCAGVPGWAGAASSLVGGVGGGGGGLCSCGSPRGCQGRRWRCCCWVYAEAGGDVAVAGGGVARQGGDEAGAPPTPAPTPGPGAQFGPGLILTASPPPPPSPSHLQARSGWGPNDRSRSRGSI